MEKLERILKENGCQYTVKREKNIYIYNINDEKMVIVIKNKKDNIFSISRKCFNIIDGELLPYSVILVDNKDNIYYYDIKEPNNVLRKAFDSCNKELIFFGKEILNKKIETNELNKILKI